MNREDGRTRVLFVCVGNACRSPMAEAIARLDAPDAIEAFSAGLAPMGYLAGMTKQTLLRNGYWMEGLESKGISPEIWGQADIVVNMSGRPREKAFREYSKVEDWDINDPFGENPDKYQEVFEKIRLRISELAEECRKENAQTCGVERRAQAIQEQEEASLLSDAAAPALRDPGLAAAAPRIDAPARKRPDRKALPSRAKLSRGRRIPGALLPRWVVFGAMGALVGLFSLSMEWMTIRRDVRSEMGAPAAQEAKISRDPAQAATPPSFGATPNPADPGEGKMQAQAPNADLLPAEEPKNVPNSRVKDPDPQVPAVEHPPVNPIPSASNLGKENAGSQLHAVKPLLAEERKSIPNPSREDPGQRLRGLQGPAANRALESSRRHAESVLARNQTSRETSPAAGKLNRPPAVKVQPLPVGIMPVAVRHLEPPTASPAIMASTAPPVEIKEIANLIPVAKQPAIPAKITGAVAILADPYPSLRIPDRGISKKQRQATSLQLGHLLSRIEPIYPEDAKQQGIQGTVKLHAIIGRQGSVENLESVDGSPVLVAAAVSAVRQWRYTETLLAGQTVETEEDIAITFRLSNPTPPAN